MATHASKVRHRELTQSLVSATLLANAISCFRAILIILVLNLSFLSFAWMPLSLMAFICLIPGLYFIWGLRFSRERVKAEVALESPFSLKPALIFGTLYAIVLFFIQVAKEYGGDLGIYLLSIISGFTDIDAIVVSLSNVVGQDVLYVVGVMAVVLAVCSNLIFKMLIARIGGVQFWKGVSLPLSIAIVIGIVITYLMYLA